MSAKSSQVVRVSATSPRCKTRSLFRLTPFAWASLMVATVGCTGNVGGPAGGGEDDDGKRVIGGACTERASVGSGRWRRLTTAQYVKTVQDLLGEAPESSSFLPDSVTGAFKTNALFPVEEGHVDSYDRLAKSLAEKATGKLDSLLECDTEAKGEDECAARFIKTFGGRAYRRPLVEEEEQAFDAVYKAGKEESFAAGIRLVVQAMLASPSFLYMVESGTPTDDGLRKLTGYEVATRLAYVLTGTMPDSDLFAAAAKGSLDTVDGVRAYAKKLMASDKFIEITQQFHSELLGVEVIADTNAVSKGNGYPQFDTEMREAMMQEPRKFVEYVMTKGSGSVEELLSGAYVFPEGPLTKVYGDDLNVDADGRAEITDGTRKGILTLAAVHTAFPKAYSPKAAIFRGHLVRREFLCETVPPPAVAVDFSKPEGWEKMTAQELLREHQTDETCRPCHRLMDSVGFAFEGYDGIGAHRTEDTAGNSIDTSGEIVDLADDGKFQNVSEMADVLAKAPEVRSCMSQQWVRFALGRDPESEDECSMQQLTTAFSKGKGNIKEAVLSLVSSDAFRFIRGE